MEGAEHGEAIAIMAAYGEANPVMGAYGRPLRWTARVEDACPGS